MKSSITSTKANLIYTLLITLFFSCLDLSSQTQLWGVSYMGGSVDSGTVFRTNGNGSNFSTAKSFYKSTGSLPSAGFSYYNGVEYFGLTYEGGINNAGAIYSYNPTTNAYVKKVDFNGTLNGAKPYGLLVLANDGMFYGMASEGGINNLGVLFQYDPVNNVCLKKIDFNGANNGATPIASLIQAPNGKLYGMTYLGGVNDMGILFEYNIVTNDFVKKVDFSGAANGSYPLGSLCLGPDGRLYGMTQSGGVNDAGVIFSYTYPTNTYLLKRSFDQSTGDLPQGSLFKASSGMLYGTTLAGGTNTHGVLFKFDAINNTYDTLVNFNGPYSGNEVYGDVMQASNGNLYGYTQTGGTNNAGVLFEVNPTTEVFAKKFDFGGANGRRPVFGSLIEIPLTIIPSGLSNVYCAGAAFPISYSLTGAYETNNNFNVELSDATGAFGSPTIIGSVVNNQEGTINVTIPSNTLAGNAYRIRVVSTNPVVNGADNGANITIGNPVVVANASATSLCAGDSLLLYGTGAQTYSWSHSVTDSVVIFPISAETYTVIGTDDNNCSNTSAVTVAYHNLPIVSANASSNSICAGSFLILTGGGASSYVWSNGVSDGVAFSPMAGNTYTVTGTDNANCSDTATVNVPVFLMPNVSVTTNNNVLSALQPGADYQWLDCNNSNAIISNETNQSFAPILNGDYSVEIATNGCVDTSLCVSINSIGLISFVLNKELQIKVYPNPANGIINVELLTKNEEATVSLENILGQTVYTAKMNKGTQSIDVSNFETGVYLVKVKTEKGLSVQKLVVE